jgi:hypothetical protein
MEHWEYIIAIGIQTLLFLAGGYGMVLRNDWSNRMLKEQMTAMQTELQKLAEVITLQAVQTTRIDNLADQMSMLQHELADLRRGRGYITERNGD